MTIEDPTPGPVARLAADARTHPLPLDACLAVLLALALGIASVTVALDSDLGGWQVPVLITVVVLHASVAIRRVGPVLAYGLAGAATLLLALAPPITAGTDTSAPAIVLPSAIVFFVLLYSATTYGPRWLTQLAVLPAVAGIVLVAVRVGALRVGTGTESAVVSPWLYGVVLLAVTILVWFLGRLRRSHLAYLAADRNRIVADGISSERNRIAREIHDVVSHSLAVMIAQAEGGRMAAARKFPDAEPVFTTIAGTGRSALADMRAMVGLLEGATPESRAPAPGLGDIQLLADNVRATGLTVTVTETGTPRPLSPSAELASFRVVQESLTNVVKHAHARAVSVRLDWAAGLRVEVSDDGQGSTRSPGSGLTGLTHRVRAVGGELTVSSNHGFTVTARIPAREEP